ncbi:MAG: Flp pilus assembly protein CpaB [Pseudomonadota bacterium]
MKNQRALMMMAVAILFGIGAVALASRWLLRQSAAGNRRVVVAALDVNRGQRLTPEMLRLAEWPSGNVPRDAYLDPARLSDRVLRNSVLKGEPLSDAKLAPAGTLGGLSALIGEGKRAITVRVNDVIGVAGFALPGNYVDIIVHMQRDPGQNEKMAQGALHISKIVLERILVLAVAQEVGRDDSKPRVVNAVTLEVTPGQAENLDLARSVGTLSLALRNQVDPNSPDTAGATKLTLLDETPAPPKPEPIAPRPAAPSRPVLAHAKRDCVNVLNGLHSSQECF